LFFYTKNFGKNWCKKLVQKIGVKNWSKKLGVKNWCKKIGVKNLVGKMV